MKNDIKNIAASVRARLENNARLTNRPFGEVLQYYGMERFLYRLSSSPYVDRFVLKGALMFAVWDVAMRRTTQDIDLSGRFGNQVSSIEEAVRKICKTPVPPDGIVFDVQSIRGKKIKLDGDYEGVRIKFVGFLERARISIQIDVGFGDVIHPRPKMIYYPVILELPKPRLKGYPSESVVSEKFESMVKLRLLNSRMKDFYDLWLMLHQFDFNGASLEEALRKTFQHRETPLPAHAPIFAAEIYDEKSDRQVLWKSFLTKREIQAAPERLGATALEIEAFLSKPLEAISKGQKFQGVWKKPGPWRRKRPTA